MWFIIFDPRQKDASHQLPSPAFIQQSSLWNPLVWLIALAVLKLGMKNNNSRAFIPNYTLFIFSGLLFQSSEWRKECREMKFYYFMHGEINQIVPRLKLRWIYSFTRDKRFHFTFCSNNKCCHHEFNILKVRSISVSLILKECTLRTTWAWMDCKRGKERKPSRRWKWPCLVADGRNACLWMSNDGILITKENMWMQGIEEGCVFLLCMRLMDKNNDQWSSCGWKWGREKEAQEWQNTADSVEK